jgi:hypothetical protein
MKSGKYLSGGLIRGPGGRALKSFIKSDLYKGLKSALIKRVDKLYSKGVSTAGKITSKQRSDYLKGLKRLDIKNQKAEIIGRAMRVAKNTKVGVDIPRPIKAALLRGARGIGKYQKKVGEQGKAYLAKGERMIRGKRDN